MDLTTSNSLRNVPLTCNDQQYSIIQVEELQSDTITLRRNYDSDGDIQHRAVPHGCAQIKVASVKVNVRCREMKKKNLNEKHVCVCFNFLLFKFMNATKELFRTPLTSISIVMIIIYFTLSFG